MRYIITLMATALAVAACKQHDEVLQTWVGAPQAKLLSIWGEPTETHVAQDGTKILVYSRPVRSGVIVPSSGQSTAGPAACETVFMLEQGRVTGHTSGAGCQ